MAARALEDLAGGALLDEAARLHRVREESSARIMVAATEWAYQHSEGRFELDLVNRGGERFVRLGGEGTPKVAEFAPAAFGARLQLSPYAAARLIGEALDLKHRLPRLWDRSMRLEVRESYARFVARRTRDLTIEQARFVDERVAESADGRLPWSRFETLVEASIVQADPVAAREREEAAAKEQFAKPTHSDEHGMRGFYVRADFATIARLDATVAYVADALAALGDEGTLDERRVKAILVLANPTQAVELLRAYAVWRRGEAPEPASYELDESKLLPAVWLFVHVGGSGAARVEGMGPVTDSWVREHLGECCRFKITEVLDPLGQTAVDSYEIPDRHRQAVRLMTPADTFPFAASTSRGMPLDHTKEYKRGAQAPPGQSRVGNYGPMVTFHHRIKTHARGWCVEQPFPGIYVWRDPYGAFYLVDHTGTRALGAGRPPRPRVPSRIEMYVTDLVLEAA
jgi:hypothetical protein